MSKPSSECRITVRRVGPLSGEVVVPGAKNSVLKLMAASLLADGVYEITNVPAIVDVSIMADLLEAIGLSISLAEPGIVTITNTGALTPVAPFELAQRIRASVNVLGPLLARCGSVRLPMPGGDDFGTRPIDMHIAGLEAMGATFRYRDGWVEATAERLRGAEITFDFPSVGATENVLTAAVLADGVTTIHNAAREPEIIDLCEFLVAAGAQISGAGTSTLQIVGVASDALHGCDHETVPDRIQAATYIAACGVAGGELDLLNATPGHMAMALSKFRDMGMEIARLPYGLRVAAPDRLRATDVATLPYPGVATDYKPVLIAMLSVASGVSTIVVSRASATRTRPAGRSAHHG